MSYDMSKGFLDSQQNMDFRNHAIKPINFQLGQDPIDMRNSFQQIDDKKHLTKLSGFNNN